MTTEDRHRVKVTSCGACVYKIEDGVAKVLLVRPFKTRSMWGIPKGHLNEGEGLDACALREVLEETGICVVLEDRLPDVMTSYRDTDKTVVSWLARQTCNVDPHPADGENHDVKWFDIDDLPQLHRYQVTLLTAATTLIRNMTHAAT